MDPRLTPFNGQVAHRSLQGKVNAERFVEGRRMRVSQPVLNLLDAPHGARQCQLLHGQGFQVLEDSDELVWGFAEGDGYVGWLPKQGLSEDWAPTDIVAVPRMIALEHPDVTHPGHETILSFGSRVRRETASASPSGWVAITLKGDATLRLYVRDAHLQPADWVASDPVTIAEAFLHTPYLWGGNSGFGVDCSGLVQLALAASGVTCPRDSDLQFAAFDAIDPQNRARGDLVFWKGHVGLLCDRDTLLHANAHHMMVAKEPLSDAVERIAAKEFGDVTGYARPKR